MKLFREEVRPLVDIVFDVSDSMFVGGDKETRSLELFYFAAEASVRGAASAAFFFVRGDKHLRLNEDAVFSHAWPDQVETLTPSDPGTSPDIATVPLRAHSMRIFVSDLLFPGSPAAYTASLAARKGRGIIFAPASQSESDPGWQGNYEFIDAESKTHHLNRIEQPLLKRYLDAYRRHFDLWKTYAAKHGVALARIPAHTPFDKALQQEALPQHAIEVV